MVSLANLSFSARAMHRFLDGEEEALRFWNAFSREEEEEEKEALKVRAEVVVVCVVIVIAFESMIYISLYVCVCFIDVRARFLCRSEMDKKRILLTFPQRERSEHNREERRDDDDSLRRQPLRPVLPGARGPNRQAPPVHLAPDFLLDRVTERNDSLHRRFVPRLAPRRDVSRRFEKELCVQRCVFVVARRDGADVRDDDFADDVREDDVARVLHGFAEFTFAQSDQRSRRSWSWSWWRWRER